MSTAKIIAITLGTPVIVFAAVCLACWHMASPYNNESIDAIFAVVAFLYGIPAAIVSFLVAAIVCGMIHHRSIRKRK